MDEKEVCLQLKPCPFCGKSPTVRPVSAGIYHERVFSVTYSITCQNCNIDFRADTIIDVQDGEGVTVQNGFKECVDIWNRRVNNG